MKISLLTLSIIFGLNCFAQNVYIPDATFKSLLINNSSINTNFDSEIQVSEAAAVTGLFTTSSISISDFTGIEAFTSITEFKCYNNPATTLDLSANLALTTIWCHSCQLTSLNLGNNTVLEELRCYSNQLSNLDVSTFPNLNLLYCNINNLTTLDLSSNPNLVELYCFNNEITNLDVSSNPSLTKLLCNNNPLTSLKMDNGNNTGLTQITTINTPDLLCIEVDDASFSNANWTGTNFQFDPISDFSTDCATFLSVENNENINVVIYPNPTNNNINIQLENNNNTAVIEVNNAIGQVISVQKSNGMNTLVSLPAEPGIYFVKITQGNNSTTQKAVKQ